MSRWLRVWDDDDMSDGTTERRGLPLRKALLLGFGVTFGVWLFAGFYFAHKISEVGRSSEDLNGRYMRTQDSLSNLRAQVLLGSIYLRDALLDPTPSPADYRHQIEEAYQAADQALGQYQPIEDSPEARQRTIELRRELDEFRDTLTDILSTDASRWLTNARTLLRDRIMPKRQVVVSMSEDVQALNRTAFVQQQAGIARIYQALERQIWESLGVALLASLGIALTAMKYASKLERRVAEQRAREQQHTHDLQRLSAKLVSVQEEERRTIARELHDEVGQLLTAVKVELSVAQRHIDGGNGPQALDDARAITERAIHTVRDLSHLLHPSMLDDLGLPSAIDSYLREFGKRHGIHVELQQNGMEQRLQPATEATAYRIVQEALTNVANHAQAAACRVRLQRLPTTLLVTVDDDGRGFDPDTAENTDTRRGLGLLGMRERVAQLFGTLRLESAPGRGTRLTVVLPVGPAPALHDEVASHG